MTNHETRNHEARWIIYAKLSTPRYEMYVCQYPGCIKVLLLPIGIQGFPAIAQHEKEYVIDMNSKDAQILDNAIREANTKAEQEDKCIICGRPNGHHSPWCAYPMKSNRSAYRRGYASIYGRNAGSLGTS